ncbi:MAG TPA: S8 family serine peptidase [Actinomycetota bacterium]|nr:S8 family serine peptidase [Actinomycetota bacterium]
MRLRRSLALVLGLVLALMVQGIGQSAVKEGVANKGSLRERHSGLPDGFVPAAVRSRQLNRYFVEMKAPAASDAVTGTARATQAVASASVADAALRSQREAIAQVRNLGGTVTFRYRILVNAFSAKMSAQAASQLAKRPDVARVQPVSIVRKTLSTSVPFIGATKVWQDFGVRGQGMRVAIVDTGIDYTHASFGGEGTVQAYEANDPTFIEQGSFPTAKVIGGFDFVGENYDVLDADTSNDIPRPDFDPLDEDGHGTHTGSTVAGIRVPGQVGRGVAPAARLFAYKVWDVGNSTDDVLVAAYERAVDPNQDGSVSDAVDVLSFSGGVDYGTLNSLEAKAAQRVVDLGTVFVASAGNSGNQPAGGSAYITGTPSIARGVIGVAASIDQFFALDLDVNSPAGLELPLDGLAVHQPWSAPVPEGGHTADLFDGRAVDADEAAHFCDPVAPGSLTGETVVVFRGTCAVSTKVFNAQTAGAVFVVVRNNAAGAPVPLASGGETITIPAVMIGMDDADAILEVLSPNAPASFNDGTVNVTITDTLVENTNFIDAMTSFTSEGPARLTSDLKPDISAPGSAIEAASVGTGNEAAALSGTSMAAPHVSGVATLLRQLHPKWTPAQIKGALMNQAKRNLKDNLLNSPVPATTMGSGRVQAFQSARAVSVAWPGSLSFGFAPTPDTWSAVRTFRVRNFHNKPHGYTVTGQDRYSDYDPAMTRLTFSLNGTSFAPSRSFNLNGGQSRRVWVRLRIDPGVVSVAEQEFGWYYFLGNMDGSVVVSQSGNPTDVLRLPWHVVPLTTSDDAVSPSELDLTEGPGELELIPGGAGQSHLDLYHLGTTDPAESRGEEDIVAVGARSFTGASIDGEADGVPPGEDELGGIDWLTFLSSGTEMVEPVEIGVQTWNVHNITETLEVDVFIDAGADGQFADEDLQADYLAAKLPQPGGEVCLFDLSLADPFEECAELYFPDYSNYNSNLVGVAVNAEAIGLSDGSSMFSYRVEACTGTFSGDVPGFICDHAGEIDDETGTWDLVFDATDPALQIEPLTCQGFWGGPVCDGANPIVVDVGSAEAGDDPTILALFPNDRPRRSPVLVETQT